MKARDVSGILSHFDDLPDDAVVPRKVTSLLTGKSLRQLQQNPPGKPRYLSERCIGDRVGDIRARLSEGQSPEAA